jgi:hypothetical protein
LKDELLQKYTLSPLTNYLLFTVVRGHDPTTEGMTTNKHVDINFNVYKCFFKDCRPPPDPNTVPPEDTRPDDAVLWSVKETWSDAEEGWGGNLGGGQYDLPVDGDSVKIPTGIIVIIKVL